MTARKKRKFPLGIGDTLLSEERLRILDPGEVMDAFSVGKNRVLLDVGCGPGAFLEAASSRVGEKGKVYAIDIQEPFVNMARRLAGERRLANVVFAVSREDRIPLGDGIADVAIMVNTLHELEGNGTLKEVYRLLKKGGVLGVVEYEKAKTPLGPPVSERMGQEQSEAILAENGFEVEKAFSIGRYHYGVSARKA